MIAQACGSAVSP